MKGGDEGQTSMQLGAMSPTKSEHSSGDSSGTKISAPLRWCWRGDVGGVEFSLEDVGDEEESSRPSEEEEPVPDEFEERDDDWEE